MILSYVLKRCPVCEEAVFVWRYKEHLEVKHPLELLDVRTLFRIKDESGGDPFAALRGRRNA